MISNYRQNVEQLHIVNKNNSKRQKHLFNN